MSPMKTPLYCLDVMKVMSYIYSCECFSYVLTENTFGGSAVTRETVCSWGVRGVIVLQKQ